MMLPPQNTSHALRAWAIRLKMAKFKKLCRWKMAKFMQLCRWPMEKSKISSSVLYLMVMPRQLKV